MLEKWRHRALMAWSGLVGKHPFRVLGLCLALALASVLFTLWRWHFQSDRNALIDPGLEWNQRFVEWTRSFSGTYDLTVVIDLGRGEVTPEARRAGERLADDLGEALEREKRHVERVAWRFEVSRASPRAMRILDLPEFEARLEQLRQAQPIFASPTPGELLSAVTRGFVTPSEPTDPSTMARRIAGLTSLVDAMTGAISDPASAEQAWRAVALTGTAARAWEYIASADGRLLFLRITPRRDAQALGALSESIQAIRRLLAQTLARHSGSGLTAGLTGIEAIENDETRAVTRDSTIASIVALILVAGVMILAFHSFRTPLLALAALVIGIAWSFGFLFLAVGHLQVLSVFFTVILLGLGIAYGIHLAARFELVRHHHPDDEAGFALALDDSFETMGPGIVTGAVTTAAAFATTVFTDFRGVAEMGLIAAVGVMLCLLAMFTAFPALLRICKPRHRDVRPMTDRVFHLFEERWLTPFVRHPRWTLLASGAVLGVSLLATSRMTFDYNLEALLPRGVDSVRWQRRIVESGQSIYSGVSIVRDLEEARARVNRFREMPTVGEVRGVGLLFPKDEAHKLQRLAEVRASFGPEPTVDAAGAPDVQGQLVLLQGLILQSRAIIPEALRSEVDQLSRSLDRAVATLAALEPSRRADRLALLRESYARWRGRLLQAFDPAPLTLDDLPEEFSRSYRGKDGQIALEVDADTTERGRHAAMSPLDPRFLPRFVRDMRTVDPNVTGVIVQYYQSGDLIQRSYLWAGLWALAIVFGMVLVDFRRLDDAVLSLAPVFLGFTATFGIMWLLGMKVNPANIIALPLMFGIGVDSGVHIIHRFRQDATTRPLGLTDGTGKAITLTSLTSMIGFGSLMLASHRGIFSLGFVMTVGLGLTLLACLTMMPAWLELRARRAERESRTRPSRGAG